MGIIWRKSGRKQKSLGGAQFFVMVCPTVLDLVPEGPNIEKDLETGKFFGCSKAFPKF